VSLQEENPCSLPLTELARNCAQQTLLFFQRVMNDTRYCFEIFRRAVVEKDQQAWDLLHELYSDQLCRWMRRHPRYSACLEDEAYFANRALEKFWQAVPPAQFARFPDLPRLLSYLQMCLHSAISEHVRDLVRARYEVDLEEAEQRAGAGAVENEIVSGKQGTELWRAVAARLNDQREIQVAYDSFVLDLKPSEILTRSPGVYESTREIYRIKENILSRLRRDSELARLAGLMPEMPA
jgi:hypothetical protein